jgi:hypothetical protein
MAPTPTGRAGCRPPERVPASPSPEPIPASPGASAVDRKPEGSEDCEHHGFIVSMRLRPVRLRTGDEAVIRWNPSTSETRPDRDR